MKTPAAPYKPALRWNGLTRFYDRVMALTMWEDQFRTLLLNPIRGLKPRYVLDVVRGRRPCNYTGCFPKRMSLVSTGMKPFWCWPGKKTRRKVGL